MRQSEQLIELKDQKELRQQQQMEEQELRDLEEREHAIRQLEVRQFDLNILLRPNLVFSIFSKSKLLM
jgi:hypothetical protein